MEIKKFNEMLEESIFNKKTKYNDEGHLSKKSLKSVEYGSTIKLLDGPMSGKLFKIFGFNGQKTGQLNAYSLVRLVDLETYETYPAQAENLPRFEVIKKPRKSFSEEE